MKYNILSKFYIKDDYIIVKNYSYKITIPYTPDIYNFLIYLEEYIYFDKIIIHTYHISEKLITLLSKIDIIIIEEYNSWIESLWFDSIIQNPPIWFKNITDKDLWIIYENITHSFYQSFNKEEWHIYINYNNKIPLITLNSKCSSTRKKVNNNTIEKDFILWVNDTIVWDWKKYVLYGSGWWFYSISSIIVNQNDYIYLFDKYKQIYFYRHIPWFFKDYTTNCLIPNNETNFQSYTSHVILFSVFRWVFQKYWNRWYRYIQIESWSIGCLWRQYMNHYNIPYLELQWFLEQNIYKLFKRYNIIDINKIIITHTIACW